MKTAIDTFSYYMHFGKHWYVPKNPVDIRWYCETSKKLGMNGLHIDPYHIDLLKDTNWVRDFAENNNMYIELGACGTSIEELRPYIEAADLLGAQLLRTFAGGNCLDGRELTKKRTEEAVLNLKKTLPFAQKHGIKLAIENHGDIYIEDMLAILNIESEFLGVCFDSGNFAFTGEDPLVGLQVFGKRVLCTHLKDVCDEKQYPDAKPFKTVNNPVHFCALGDGYLPLGEMVTELKKAGVENITLEICSPYIKSMTENELFAFEKENVRKSIDYLFSLKQTN